MSVWDCSYISILWPPETLSKFLGKTRSVADIISISAGTLVVWLFNFDESPKYVCLTFVRHAYACEHPQLTASYLVKLVTNVYFSGFKLLYHYILGVNKSQVRTPLPQNILSSPWEEVTQRIECLSSMVTPGRRSQQKIFPDDFCSFTLRTLKFSL